MSQHKTPLTELEKTGLEAHHLPIGTPSQLSDSFRNGMKWALANQKTLLAIKEHYQEAERVRFSPFPETFIDRATNKEMDNAVLVPVKLLKEIVKGLE